MKEVTKMDKATIAKAGTFVLNKGEPIHRWYSYMEGYSSCLVVNELNKILETNQNISTIYDPFNGTGTTGLVAGMKGISPYYSESNPFMQFVAETKINAIQDRLLSEIIAKLEWYKQKILFLSKSEYTIWDGFEKYFDLEQMQYVLALKRMFVSEPDAVIKNILMLALSSILVKASKMIRRGDLRYATKKEYHAENVIVLMRNKLDEMIQDLNDSGGEITNRLVKVSNDARENCEQDLFDCVITSPPYLNGTNYIRNTKLELKLNDYIKDESELPVFHTKGIIAGINNVSKRNGSRPILEEVTPYMADITKYAYDQRIPKMVSGYFYDMNDVIKALSKSVKNGGYFIMDIGDSQFGGVHIPTHDILSSMCNRCGFIKYSEKILRERRSKNGMMLSQRLVRFRLEK